MSGPACRLSVHPPRRQGEWLRLEADLAVGRLAPRRIWFEVETPDSRLPERDARPFVLASLVAAMRAGLPLVADAPLDRVTRRNLQLWQGAFAAWRPALMSRIEIRAPEAGPGTPAKGRVTAFSGGADSHFTLARARAEGIPLDAGLMVQGFDIPLGDDDAFARAFARVRGTLGGHEVRALRARTNVRELDRACHLSWQHETHGPYLAATLACLQPWYGSAVIPSSFGHEHPVLPWASNALTDPLLGGELQEVLHHGGEWLRVDKMLHLSQDPDFARNARVCYLNDSKDANCGRCYKCATLQVAFWVSGVPRPGAFPTRASPGDLAEMELPAPSYRNTYRVLAEKADQAGLGETSAALRQALARQPLGKRSPGSSFLAWLRRLPMR